jgi:omega-6 fatty acid desaturase (delta-12 desaturase)
VPYFSWKYSHKHHHSNTNNVNHDEVFVPKKKKEIVIVVAGGWGVTEYLQHPLGRILMIALMLLLGWPFYLICNVSGKKYPQRIYVGFVIDIDIKILRGGGGGGFYITNVF